MTRIPLGSIALFLEGTIFPVLYFFYGVVKSVFVYHSIPQIVSIIRGDTAFDAVGVAVIADFLSNIILVLMNFFVALAFLNRRPVVGKPEGFLDIVVPLAATFFWQLFNIIGWHADPLRISFLPSHMRMPAVAAGALCGLGGWALSVVSIACLRRSFGLFAQAREPVYLGPYRLVRHPIYAGYIITSVGLILVNPFFNYALLFIVYVWLLVWRARIEEAKIVSFFPAYAQYQNKVPFLFPGRKRLCVSK